MGQTPTVIFKYAHHLLTHAYTHKHTHAHSFTHEPANTYSTFSHSHKCTHSQTCMHTYSCIHKPAHMACKEFIWCFLVIATKTPNLDVSRSFPRTPDWRANFNSLPLSLTDLCPFSSMRSFFRSHLSERKKAVLYNSSFYRQLFA